MQPGHEPHLLISLKPCGPNLSLPQFQDSNGSNPYAQRGFKMRQQPKITPEPMHGARLIIKGRLALSNHPNSKPSKVDFNRIYIFVRSCMFVAWYLQPSDHPPTASHSATTKKSFKTAPCDEHTTSNQNSLSTHPTSLLAQRLSLTPHAALLLSLMCHPLVSATNRSSSLDIATEHYGAAQRLVKQLLSEVLPICKKTFS